MNPCQYRYENCQFYLSRVEVNQGVHWLLQKASVTNQPGAPSMGRLFSTVSHSSWDSGAELRGRWWLNHNPNIPISIPHKDNITTRTSPPCSRYRLFYLCWYFITKVWKVTILTLLIMYKLETYANTIEGIDKGM